MASSASDRELALFEQVHREVAPVTLSNNHFDEFGYNIVQYSRDLINKNNMQGRGLDIADIILHWTIEVRRVYAVGSSKCEELVSQVSRTVSSSYKTKGRLLIVGGYLVGVLSPLRRFLRKTLRSRRVLAQREP